MKVHVHSEQFDGHPHSWCGRGATAVPWSEFEATDPKLRCALCDAYWFPTGQPDWHFEQAKKTLEKYKEKQGER